MRRIAILSFVLAIVASTNILVTASPASACSCGESVDRESFDEADAVFIAEVDRIHTAREGGPVEVAILAVSDVYKGDVDRLQAVTTPAESASCRTDFSDDAAYIVFARNKPLTDEYELEEGFFFVHACSGTRTIDSTDELGFTASAAPPTDAGPPPLSAIQAQLGDPRSSLFPEAVIFVAVLGFILGLAAWFSRKGRPAT